MKPITIITRSRCWNRNGALFTTIINEPFAAMLPFMRPITIARLADNLPARDPEPEEGFEDLYPAAKQAPRRVRLLDSALRDTESVREGNVEHIVVEYGEDDGGASPVLVDTYSVRTVETGWRFTAEEEVGDPGSPILFLGVLTNGDDCLYYRVERDADGVDICTIHNSLTFEDGSEEVSYPWTADNDQKVVDALDAVTDRRLIAGEESVLRDIEFDQIRYATCSIRFKDDDTTADDYVIKLSSDYNEKEDDDIFFYCDGLEKLKSLMREDNGQDFVVLSYELSCKPGWSN